MPSQEAESYSVEVLDDLHLHTELRISYLDYIDLNLEQRASFLKSCADESQLCKLKTNYRMYKYSKWYKELQANNPDHLPVTTLLAQQVNGDK